MYRHDSTRSTCQARRVERVEPCCSTSWTRPKCMSLTRSTCRARRVKRVEPCCWTSSTLPKCMGRDKFHASSSSCRVCWAVLFDKLDTAKMHGPRQVWRVESVELVVWCFAVHQTLPSQNAWARNVEWVESCRDVTSRVEFGLTFLYRYWR